MIVQRLLSKEAALEVNARVNQLGVPAEGKLLIAVDDDTESKTAAGIIIPGQKLEGVQRRGVLIQKGWLEGSNPFIESLQIGNIITYGDYAGKKVELVDYSLPSYKFVVLSITEVSYIENNNL